MQKWDYLMVIRSRGFEPRPSDKNFHEPTEWVTKVYAKAEEKKWEGKLIDLLLKLGDDGWELATTCTRSGTLGGAHATQGTTEGTIDTPNFSNRTSGIIKGTIFGITTDYAGFTDTEEMIFKRPRQ